MKKIGIVGWNVGDNSFGTSKAYLHWLGQFGDVQILTPKKGIVEDLDILILPGGADISPQSYNEVPGYYTGNTDVMKQYFYDNNLDQYINANIPIFGICLGFQQLCSKFGGKLLQDGAFPYSTKSRGELVESLNFNPNSSVREFLDIKVLPTKHQKYNINSIHHQASFQLPDNIEVLARSTEYGNIELVKFSENIFGAQYHPEEFNDQLSSNIINYLLNQ